MVYEAGTDDYAGGPSELMLLPHFGGDVACRIWVDADVSILNVYFISFTIYTTYSNYYFTYLMLELKFMLEYI